MCRPCRVPRDAFTRKIGSALPDDGFATKSEKKRLALSRDVATAWRNSGLEPSRWREKVGQDRLSVKTSAFVCESERERRMLGSCETDHDGEQTSSTLRRNDKDDPGKTSER